jgi:hypothetical protein
MQLQHPFVQLPFTFDANRLTAEIEALGEAVWLPHPEAQAGNWALPLIAVDGDPQNQGVAGPMRPTPHLDACPYLRHVWTAGRKRIRMLI